MIQGIRPGPLLMTQQPILVWSLIASMFIGNVLLLVMNLPMAPLFAALLRIPYAYLAPGILALSLIGAFAATLTYHTLIAAVGFGFAGYFMIKADLPRAPLVLALVLGPLMETSLRQSLMLSLGSPWIFVQRPIAAFLLAVVIVSLLVPLFGSVRRRMLARRVA
jgi:putative tricarboxylic transport membrane protein